MLGVTWTLCLAVLSVSSAATDQQLSEATTDVVAPSLATSPPHSIRERAAELPVPEEDAEDGRERDGEVSEEAASVGRSERDCFRTPDIFNRRSALDKNFMRLGRSEERSSVPRDLEDFSRFGRNRNFIRLGRSGGPSPGNNFIRLGRSEGEEEESRVRSIRGSANNFMRFGRRDAESDADAPRFSRNLPNRNFMRFGRSSPDLVRNGRTQQQSSNLDRNFMRLGRSWSEEDLSRAYRSNRNFMRLGRSNDRNFIRFGRSNNFMRFGRSGGDDEDDDKEMQKNGDTTSDSRVRTKRSAEEDSEIPSEEAYSDDRDLPSEGSPAFLVFPFEGSDEGQSRGRSDFIRFG